MSNTTIVSSETRRSWKNLNEDLDRELRDTQAQPVIVQDEDEFRTNFSTLPSFFYTRDPAYTKAIFDRLHEPVHLFARVIDKAVGITEPHTLKELFFTIGFAITQVRMVEIVSQ